MCVCDYVCVRERETSLRVCVFVIMCVRVRAGPAIAIGELGDCLGRQMGWGRPSVALGPTSH